MLDDRGGRFWLVFFFYLISAVFRFSLCVTYGRHTASHAPGEARRYMACYQRFRYPVRALPCGPFLPVRLRSCRSLTSVMATSGRSGFGPEWHLAADPLAAQEGVTWHLTSVEVFCMQKSRWEGVSEQNTRLPRLKTDRSEKVKLVNAQIQSRSDERKSLV